MSTKRMAWVFLAFGCLALLGAIVLRNAERGRFARALSTYASGPQGARALYLTLGELGFRTARWSQDLAGLPRSATLIALGSCESTAARALSRYEREELLSWVERGGLLVVAGARNYIPPALGVAFDDDYACELLAGRTVTPRVSATPPAGVDRASHRDAGPAWPSDEVEAALSQLVAVGSDPSAGHDVLAVALGGALKGLPFVPFRQPARLLTDPALHFETLLAGAKPVAAETTELVPLALTYTRGRGRVIVLSAANMLQNDQLVDAEGAALFARLLSTYAPRDLLIFDEYHLGLGERRSLTQYLRQAGMLPLFGQLLLVACVALWRAGARMGAVRITGAPVFQRSATDFVSTLGRLYARVDDRRAAVRTIARAALGRIAQHYALGNLPAVALQRELLRRGATHASEAVRAIAQVGGNPGDEPLVASVMRIDAACDAAQYEWPSRDRRPSDRPGPDFLS